MKISFKFLPIFLILFVFCFSSAFGEQSKVEKKVRSKYLLTNSSNGITGAASQINQPILKKSKGKFKLSKVEMKSSSAQGFTSNPQVSQASGPISHQADAVYVGPAEAVYVDEGGDPNIPDWDPSLPVNMNRPEPEWIQEIEEKIEEQGRNVPDISINPVDISSPDTPPSFLIPLGELRDLQPGSVSVAGYPYTSVSGCPPDVTFNVGANHIVEGYNSYFEVKNKSGSYLYRFNMATLFSGLPNCGNATTGFLCDPQVIYDECAAGTCPNPTDTRWVLTALWINNAGNDSRLCIAASKAGANPYPTSNFWVYEIDPPGLGIADYPHTGIQDDAIIIGYNWFGNGYGYLAAINKSKVYAGQQLGAGDTAFYDVQGGTAYRFTPQPANRIGCKQSQWPPANTRMYIILSDQSGNLDLYGWNQPTLSNSPALITDNLVTSGGTCTNPSGTYFAYLYPIDCMGVRWMDAKLRYPYLWGVRGSIETYDSFQWAQINVSVSPPTLTASGEAFETNNQIIQPDAAVDSQHNLAVVYTKASQTNSIYLGAYVTGRQGTTWGSGLTVKQGEAKYSIGCVQSGRYRWGDYNGAAVDPEDGCTIYVNGQYVRNVNNSVQDGSWIKSYRFQNCTSSTPPRADLNKVIYFCKDDVSATIFDPTGTPTNAVYHTQHGTVQGTISGTAPYFNVSPTTITDLNGQNGDNVWLTFTAGNGQPYSSANSVIDCAIKLCVYKVDDLRFGCDDDPYHDQGEVLNYKIGVANMEEGRDLPSPFQCTVTYSDPNLSDVNNPAYYPALPSFYYAYPIPSHAFRYTGSINSYCNTALNFTVDCQALDGSYWMSTTECSAAGYPNTFTKYTNYNDPDIIHENFDLGGTFPPSGWVVQTLGGTAGCEWDYGSNTEGIPNYTGGFGDYADANSDLCGQNTTMESGLVSPVFALPSGAPVAEVEFKHLIADYSGTTIGRVEISTSGQGGTYTTLATYGPCGPPAAVCDEGKKVISLSSYRGQSNLALRWYYYGQWELFWQVDDVRVRGGQRVCETSACTPAPLIVDGQYSEMDDALCSNDTYFDPSDVGNAYIFLDNIGNDWAYNLTATLSCPTCDSIFGPGAIEICDNSANYGDFPCCDEYIYAPGSDYTFNIAIDTSVVCDPANQTTIPFQMTLAADNLQGNPPQTNPISTPVLLGAEAVTAPSPNGFTYEERFQLDPGSTGSTGRWNFTTPWIESDPANWTQVSGQTQCAGVSFWPPDDNSLARASESSQPAVTNTITHTFSTADPYLATTNVWIAWSWDRGNLPTNGYVAFAYNDNRGSGWRSLVQQAGTNGAQGSGWQCYRGSLYYTVLGTYGKADADRILNNPNLQIRFTSYHPTATNRQAWFGDYYQRNYSYLCQSSSCSGNCPAVGNPPPTPMDNTVPGQPFRVYKGTNPGTVRVTWDTSCGTPDNFNIYWGDLSTLHSTGQLTVTTQHCGIGTSGNVDNLSLPDPAPGEGYWGVITAVKGSQFGRHGNDSNGNERTINGDSAACGGTKNITQNSCSSFFASGEKATFAIPVLNAKIHYDEAKEPIRLVPCDGGDIFEMENGKPAIKKIKK